MNKQNFVTQIILAIVAVFVRKLTVQQHIDKSTSLFDGVIKKIDSSLSTLFLEVEQHYTTIEKLKEQVTSERILADQKHEARAKLSALRSKISDITG